MSLAPLEQEPVELVERDGQHDKPSDMALIINAARDPNVDPAKLRELFAMCRQLKQDEAKEQFHAAMALFKKECPRIVKGHKGQIVTKGGAKWSYTYANVEDMAVVVDPVASACGLSYSWATAVRDNGNISVPHVIRHVGGHEQPPVSVPVPIDSAAGSSEQMKLAAAHMVARRLSFLSAWGLNAFDSAQPTPDAPESSEKITDEQLHNLTELVEKMDNGLERFRKLFEVDKLSDLPVSRYEEAVRRVKGAKK